MKEQAQKGHLATGLLLHEQKPEMGKRKARTYRRSMLGKKLEVPVLGWKPKEK